MKIFALCACLLAIPLSLLAGPARQNLEPAGKASTRGTSTSQTDLGEKVFANNCSRCHAAPMSLSPRITGTVIMHMRTRARLSREDERVLLKFLVP